MRRADGLSDGLVGGEVPPDGGLHGVWATPSFAKKRGRHSAFSLTKVELALLHLLPCLRAWGETRLGYVKRWLNAVSLRGFVVSDVDKLSND